MILNLTSRKIVSSGTLVALSGPMRLRGMIGRRFTSFDAMVFPHCSCIHTFFMSIPLDLVFLSSGNKVLKTVEGAPPWRPWFGCRGASCVIELPAGAIRRSDTGLGDVYDLSAEPEPRLRDELRQIYKESAAETAAAPMGEK